MSSSTSKPANGSRTAAKRLAALLLAFALGAFAPAPGSLRAAPPRRRRVVVRGRVRVRVAPPAPRVVVIPPAPSPRHVWVAGYWRWDARLGQHVWVDGVWQLAPAGRKTWVPGHWDKDDDEWEWEEGHWE